MKKCAVFVLATILLATVFMTSCSKSQSPSAPTWNGEFSIELPTGYSVSEDENGDKIFYEGDQTVGGMTIRAIPDGFETAAYFEKDFLIALGITEAADDSLGYSGGGAAGGMGPMGWSAEYFSDVPDPKDRTVHTVHQFFIMADEATVLDFWIDLMVVDNAAKDQIFSSIEIPEIARYREDPAPKTVESQDASYKLSDLPDGYSADILGERCILILKDQYPVAGMDVLKIPDGAYDPDDPHWIWLEKARLSDFGSNIVQYLGGITGTEDTWVAEFANEEPEGALGRIHRMHIYRVIENDLYDMWFELNSLTRDEAWTLSKVIQFAEE